jgi:phosphonate transport system ATP-binding protein
MMFELTNVTRHFGNKLAVDAVTLTIPQIRCLRAVGAAWLERILAIFAFNNLSNALRPCVMGKKNH